MTPEETGHDRQNRQSSSALIPNVNNSFNLSDYRFMDEFKLKLFQLLFIANIFSDLKIFLQDCWLKTCFTPHLGSVCYSV